MSQSTRWGVAAAMASLLFAGCSGAGKNPVQDGQSLTSDIVRRQSKFDAVQSFDYAKVSHRAAPLTAERSGAALHNSSLAEPTAELVSQRPGQVTGTMGTFRLEIDETLNSAVVFPRTGQTQGDKYLLGIDQFFTGRNIRVQEIKRNGDKLEVKLRFTHPFARPADLLPPSSAVKRVDLHVFNVWAGLLIQGTENYFGGTVTTNTSVLANADSYRQTGGLINLPGGVTANVFPGRWVADKTPANTDPTQDNYQPTSNGWIGSDLLNPRGGGVFHQGDDEEVMFSLDVDGSPLTLDFVILADYMDPRATPEPFKNRLPDALDPTKLRYHLPYGSGDLQSVNATVAGSLAGTTPRLVTLNIVDLDADAGVAPFWPNDGDLSQMPFASGIKQVDTSFPAGITATAAAEGAGSGSGIPTSPKKWEFSISNTGALADGDYKGLVRVVDQENDNLGSENYAQLDPNLTPLPTEFPIQVYQAVPFSVGTPVVGNKVINLEGEPTDPSYILGSSWVPAGPTQHPFLDERITDLMVDQVSGQPIFIEHGVWEGLFADDKWGVGWFIPKNDGMGNINSEILQLRNNASTPAGDWLKARPDRNKGFIVADGYIDPQPSSATADVSVWDDYPAAQATGRGYMGLSDNLNRLNFPTSNDTFYGRPTVSYIYDAAYCVEDVASWIGYYAGIVGVPTILSDRYGASAADVDPFPAHDALTDQGFNVDLAVFRGNLGTGTRQINTNHLAKMAAIRGTAVTTFDGLPADTDAWLFWALIDFDDPSTTTWVELWGDFIQAPSLNSEEGAGAVMGAGPGSLNPNTTGGFAFARDAASLFVVDSDDDTVERYDNVIIEGADDTGISWDYSGIASAGGAVVDPIDVCVTKNNLVVVLDNGGPGGTNRLVCLNPATLEVLGTRDIADTNGGEIDGGAIAIAADDSTLNIPGDESAFVLVFDNPTAATPTGGLIWYTIADA